MSVKDSASSVHLRISERAFSLFCGDTCMLSPRALQRDHRADRLSIMSSFVLSSYGDCNSKELRANLIAFSILPSSSDSIERLNKDMTRFRRGHGWSTSFIVLNMSLALRKSFLARALEFSVPRLAAPLP